MSVRLAFSGGSVAFTLLLGVCGWGIESECNSADAAELDIVGISLALTRIAGKGVCVCLTLVLQALPGGRKR